MAGAPWQKIVSKIGNRAGAAVGMGEGVGQLITANRQKKRANEAAPELIDPTQSSFLAELQQKKNALNTGSEYTSSLDAINDKMAQTQDAITANSGGDSSGAISGLLRSQQTANQGTGQLLGLGERQEGMYTGLYGDLLNKIAQRKMELQQHSQDQAMAEWAQNKQAGMANLTAGAQSFMDFKGGDKQAGGPVQLGDQGTGSGNTPTGSSMGSNGPSSARQGVEGFNSGGPSQLKPKQGLNLGSTNLLGSLMGKSSAGGGGGAGNLSSLGSSASGLLSSFK